MGGQAVGVQGDTGRLERVISSMTRGVGGRRGGGVRLWGCRVTLGGWSE